MERRIAQARGDLTGDGREENVALWGVRQEGGALWRQVRLIIEDGASGRSTRLDLPENAGYEPRLFLGNLTSRTRQDVLVSMDSGGNGGVGLYALYRWDGARYALVFDSQAYNAALTYDIRYADHYAVRAESRMNGVAYWIDIAQRGSGYLSELYWDDGMLRAPVEGMVDPLSLLYPADVNRDGLLELIAWQRISGLYHADALGDFINTLAWNGRQFALTGQTVGIFGTDARA